jgi:hypothetical protein
MSLDATSILLDLLEVVDSFSPAAAAHSQQHHGIRSFVLLTVSSESLLITGIKTKSPWILKAVLFKTNFLIFSKPIEFNLTLKAWR